MKGEYERGIQMVYEGKYIREIYKGVYKGEYAKGNIQREMHKGGGLEKWISYYSVFVVQG